MTVVVTAARSRSNSRRRPAEVRKLLVEAAERVVARKGMSASAQEIAAEAGVHRSVLYRHFANVDELVQLAAMRPFREFLEKIQMMTALSTPADPMPMWDLMVGMLTNLLDVLEEHRDFLMMSMSDASPLGDVDRDNLRGELEGVLADIVELARRQGGARGLDMPAIGVNTRMAIAMVAGVVSYGAWFVPELAGGEGRAELVERLATLLLYGVRLVPESDKAVDRARPDGTSGS